MGNKPQFSVKVKPSKDKKDKDFNFNKALKRWKRLYQEFQIKEQLISRKEFIKPSVLKREQKNQTIRQHKFDELKRKENE